MAGSEGRSRIVVVEDDARLRAAFARSLVDDFETTTVASAEALLDAIEKGQSFDLVLCDLTLPAMSGLALFQLLSERGHPAAKRFVLMSAAEVFPRMFPVPMLLKPFDRATMMLAFDAVMNAGPEAETPPTSS